MEQSVDIKAINERIKEESKGLHLAGSSFVHVS